MDIINYAMLFQFNDISPVRFIDIFVIMCVSLVIPVQIPFMTQDRYKYTCIDLSGRGEGLLHFVVIINFKSIKI